MKKIIVFVVSLIVSLLVIAATPTPVDWQALAACLPTGIQLDGYVEDSVDGANDETPYAVVVYILEQNQDEDGSDTDAALSVTLTDCVAHPGYLESAAEIGAMDDEFSYKGYTGKKSVETGDEGYMTSTYVLVVGGRYLVELSGYGADQLFQELDRLLDGIAWEQLEALK